MSSPHQLPTIIFDSSNQELLCNDDEKSGMYWFIFGNCVSKFFLCKLFRNSSSPVIQLHHIFFYYQDKLTFVSKFSQWNKITARFNSWEECILLNSCLPKI